MFRLSTNTSQKKQIQEFERRSCLRMPTFPTEPVPFSTLNKNHNLLQTIGQDIIGFNAGFWGPFGWRNYTYADHTASGKALKCIESFIEEQVLPHYANTHTIISHTSLQTTRFRDEARNIIKQAVGGSDDDEVIFCGSGSTSAIHKLVHAVKYPESKKLIVFIGPFEHHSNILPWREAASKVIQVPISLCTGQVDITFLRKNLQRFKDKKNQLLIGCFSAGSNVTGSLSDDVEITKLLHRFGALAFWDYAAAAPHVKIRMNPLVIDRTPGCLESHADDDTDTNAAFKDAIFFSGHKFLGGPGTPGVLVVKRHVLQNPVPNGVGGGTVLFTTKTGHHYLQEIHEREEGGTPDVVGSVRLGLVFRLRNLIGDQNIAALESKFCRQVLREWCKIPQIHILGDNTPRLPIISFMIQHLESGYFLHHNFVVALLNDLFGIQCRGGCMCSGPYAQVLLNIENKLATCYETVLKHKSNSGGGMILKPGFIRISMSFDLNPREVKFVTDAVKLIAIHGWKLLPYYQIDSNTATFSFNSNASTARVSSLALFDEMVFTTTSNRQARSNKICNKSRLYFELIEQAEILFTSGLPQLTQTEQTHESIKCLKNISPKQSSRMHKLRWFMLPHESILFQRLRSCSPFLKFALPFKPIPFNNYAGGMPCNGIPTNWNSIPSQLYRVWMERFQMSQEIVSPRCDISGSCEFNPNKIYEKSKSDAEHYYGYGNVENQVGNISRKDSGFSDDGFG